MITAFVTPSCAVVHLLHQIMADGQPGTVGGAGAQHRAQVILEWEIGVAEQRVARNVLTGL